MWLRWLEQTEADVPAGNDWLSREEARRLADMRFPKRRADWRLGRWTAKHAVAACLDGPQDPAEIEIRAHPCGAPDVFYRGRPAPVAISISHRGGVACCAVAAQGVAIGCDLELAEKRSSAFITDYFTTEEQVVISQVAEPDLPMVLALMWSAKESALKALRTGLRADTRSVNVRQLRICRSEAWQPLVVQHGTGEFQGMWQIKGAMVRTVVVKLDSLPSREAAGDQLAARHFHDAARIRCLHGDCCGHAHRVSSCRAPQKPGTDGTFPRFLFLRSI